MEKKNSFIACKFIYTLAYLLLKCGVVVELVTTLACHAGGRGFKSPPSRHLILSFPSLLLFCYFLLFSPQIHANNSNAQNNLPVPIKIVAIFDPINSFLFSTGDKFNFSSEKTVKYLGTDFDIINTIFKSINVPYTLRIVAWHEIVPLLASGEADMAVGVQKSKDLLEVASFPKTPLRTKHFLFYGLKKDARSETMTYENALGHNYTVGIVVGRHILLHEDY